MEQSTKEAWRRLLDEARRELPDATVRTWLEPAVPIALDDDRLIVGAPDQFAVEWNEQKHATVLARAAERVFGRPPPAWFPGRRTASRPRQRASSARRGGLRPGPAPRPARPTPRPHNGQPFKRSVLGIT